MNLSELRKPVKMKSESKAFSILLYVLVIFVLSVSTASAAATVWAVRDAANSVNKLNATVFVGDQLTILASGFPASTNLAVNITNATNTGAAGSPIFGGFNGFPVTIVSSVSTCSGNPCTDGSGNVNIVVAVPNITNDSLWTFNVTTLAPSAVSNAPGNATVFVGANFTIESVTSGTVGTTITVTGTGYESNETGINVLFNATGGAATTCQNAPNGAPATIGSTTTSANCNVSLSVPAGFSYSAGTGINVNGSLNATNRGNWTATFIIPNESNSIHTLNASGVTTSTPGRSGLTGTLTVNPSIVINLASGLVGTNVTLTGMGFNQTEPGINLLFNATGGAATSCQTGTAGAPATIGSTTTSANCNVTLSQLVSSSYLSQTGVSVNGSVNATNNGNFTVTFLVPNESGGIHTLNLSGVLTGIPGKTSVTTTFTVNPNVSLNLASGTVGTVVTATGTGFGNQEQGVNLLFNATGGLALTCQNAPNGAPATVGSTTTSANCNVSLSAGGMTYLAPTGINVNGSINATNNGNWSVTFVVPNESGNNLHTLNASGVTTGTPSKASATTTFTVNPSLVISAAASVVGGSLQVTGMGFGSVEQGINVLFNATGGLATTCQNVDGTQATVSSTTTSANCNVSLLAVGTYLAPTGINVNGSINATNNGNWTISFRVPNESGNNLHTLNASGVTTGTPGKSAVTGTLTVNPSILFSLSSGTVGTNVTVTGTGYNSTEPGINILFNATGLGATTCQNVPGGAPATIGSTTTSANCNVTLSQLTGFSYAAQTGVSVNGSINATNNGNWSATFMVPNESGGIHTLNASGVITGTAVKPALTGTFTVTPSIAISLSSGTVGTNVTLTGMGFNQTEPGINLLFNATGLGPTTCQNVANGAPATIGSTTTSANCNVTLSQLVSSSYAAQTGVSVNGSVNATNNGNFTVTFLVPNESGGIHTLNLSGVLTGIPGKTSVTTTFTVNPTLTLNLASGTVGTTVTATGTGFGNQEQGVNVLFNSNGGLAITCQNVGAGGPSPATVGSTVTSNNCNVSLAAGGMTYLAPTGVNVNGSINATNNGNWSVTFVVPNETGVVQNVNASGVTTGIPGKATATNTLLVNPSVVFNLASGIVGTNVTVVGMGFVQSAEQGINVLFNATGGLATTCQNVANGAPATIGSTTTSANCNVTLSQLAGFVYANPTGVNVNGSINATSNGNFTATFLVPNESGSIHTLNVSGIVTGTPTRVTATGTFTVNPSIAFNTSTVTPGSNVTVVGMGFGSVEAGVNTLVNMNGALQPVTCQNVANGAPATLSSTATGANCNVTLSQLAGFSYLGGTGVQVNGSITATNNGNFTATFLFPNESGGSTTLNVTGVGTATGTGQPSKTTALVGGTTTPIFTIIPSSVFSISSGIVGTNVTVVGMGFTPTEQGINVLFNATGGQSTGCQLVTNGAPATINGAATVSSNCNVTLSQLAGFSYLAGTGVNVNGSINGTGTGNFTATFIVPNESGSIHTLNLSGSRSGTPGVASALLPNYANPFSGTTPTFSINPTITISLTSGIVGTTVQAIGTGFGSVEPGVNVLFNATGGAATTCQIAGGAPATIGSTTTSANCNVTLLVPGFTTPSNVNGSINSTGNGNWTATFIVPNESGNNLHILNASGVLTGIPGKTSALVSGSTTPTFSINPSLAINFNSGIVSTIVTLTGMGFNQTEPGINLLFNATGGLATTCQNANGAPATIGSTTTSANCNVSLSAPVGTNYLAPTGTNVNSSINATNNGNFTVTFTVPNESGGIQTLNLSGILTGIPGKTSALISGSTTPIFTVNPSIAFNTTTVTPGSNVTVIGMGFGSVEAGVNVLASMNGALQPVTCQNAPNGAPATLSSTATGANCNVTLSQLAGFSYGGATGVQANGSITATNNGNFTATFLFPNETGAASTFNVTGVGSATGTGQPGKTTALIGGSVTPIFTIVPNSVFSISSGIVGTSVTVTGMGFGLLDQGINVLFNATGGLATTCQNAAGAPATIGSTTTSANCNVSLSAPAGFSYLAGSGVNVNGSINATGTGNFTATFIVPNESGSVHNLNVTGRVTGSPGTASANLPNYANPFSGTTPTFSINPTITISLVSGTVGTVVQAIGTGFGSVEPGVNVLFNATGGLATTCQNAGGAPATVGSTTTSANCNVSLSAPAGFSYLGSTGVQANGSITATNNGNWTATFIVPNESGNNLHTLNASGVLTGIPGKTSALVSGSSTPQFTVTPSVVFSLSGGNVGTTVQAVGTGFTSVEPGIVVEFNSTGIVNSPQCSGVYTNVCNTTLSTTGFTYATPTGLNANNSINATNNGNFTVLFTIPHQAASVHVMSVNGTFTGIAGKTPFTSTFTLKPLATLVPSSAQSTQTVTVTGTGFGSVETNMGVTFLLGGIGAIPLAPGTVNALGDLASSTFAVPTIAANSYSVQVGNSTLFDTEGFTILATPAAGGGAGGSSGGGFASGGSTPSPQPTPTTPATCSVVVPVLGGTSTTPPSITVSREVTAVGTSTSSISLSLQNTGTDPITNIVYSEQLPINAICTSVQATPDAQSCNDTGPTTLTWNISNIDPGQTVRLSVTVPIPSGQINACQASSQAGYGASPVGPTTSNATQVVSVDMPAQTPEGSTITATVTLSATNATIANATIKVIDPNGAELDYTSDANGQFQITATSSGTYTVSEVDVVNPQTGTMTATTISNTLVGTTSLNSVAAPPPTPQPKPKPKPQPTPTTQPTTQPQQGPGFALIGGAIGIIALVVIVIVAIVGIWYLFLRKKY